MSKVLFTEPAEYDLVSIEDYIRDILNNPTSAIRVVDDIIKEFYLLKQFPKKHGYVRDKFLIGLGTRMSKFTQSVFIFVLAFHELIIYDIGSRNNSFIFLMDVPIESNLFHF